MGIWLLGFLTAYCVELRFSELYEGECIAKDCQKFGLMVSIVV